MSNSQLTRSAIQQFDAAHGDHPFREGENAHFLVFEDGAMRAITEHGAMMAPEFFKPAELLKNKLLWQERLLEVELVPAFDAQKRRLLDILPADEDEAEAEVAALKRMQARVREARAKIAELRRELKAIEQPAQPDETDEDLAPYHAAIRQAEQNINFLNREMRILEDRFMLDFGPFDPATSTLPPVQITYRRLVANREILEQAKLDLAAAEARAKEPAEVRARRAKEQVAAERADARKARALRNRVAKIEV